MPTYDASLTDDTVIAHKKPGTVQMLRGMRDNFLAMFEGAAGAPGLQLEALEDLAAGTVEHYNSPTNRDVDSTSYVDAFAFILLQSGSLRLGFRHRIDVSGPQSDARVTVAGVTQGSWSTGSTSGATRSIDISFNRGDAIIIQHRHDDGLNSRTSTVDNVTLATSGTLIFPTFYSPYWTL